MLRKKSGEIEHLQFELFAEFPEVVHGVFLRHGGVSPPPFASLNTAENVGDEEENVQENRQRVLDVLALQQCVDGTQEHTKIVKQIDTAQHPGVCDALITTQSGLGLMTKHADCQIALCYDPINRAIANIHAGWKGNVLNIYKECIAHMRRTCGTRPEDLFVAISPSLGPEHAEFKNYKTEFPEAFWDFQIRPDYFDLWAIGRWQLETEGVLPHHIQIAEWCTYKDVNDCFSYRREKQTGRHATVISLQLQTP